MLYLWRPILAPAPFPVGAPAPFFRDREQSSMTSLHESPPDPAAWQSPDMLWHHAALCRMALPIRAPSGAFWSRETAQGSLAMGQEGEAAGEAATLPAGRGLRLLLLHVFSAALRDGTATAPLGSGIESVCAALGLEPTPARLRDLREQLMRLIGARLRVADGRLAPLPVLDARSTRGWTDPADWRPSLRLNERFLASLRLAAVPLRRAAVLALQDSVAALDAYAWLAATLPGLAGDRPPLFRWEALRQQFGGTSQSPAAFRTAFTEALAAAAAVCPEARFEAGDEGVTLRPVPASAAPEPVPAAPAPPPPAVAAPAAERMTVERREGTAPVPPSPDRARAPAPAAPRAPAPAVLEAAAPMPAMAMPVAPMPAAPVPAVPRPAPREAAPPPAPRPASPRADRSWEPRPPAPPPPAPSPGPRRPEPPRQEARPEGGRAAGRKADRIRLPPSVTGLPQAVWLKRGEAPRESMTIEVTPGAEYDPARRSLLAIEPIVLQIFGYLVPRELERIAAWVTTNAGVIQDYWDWSIDSGEEVMQQVRRVPTSRW